MINFNILAILNLLKNPQFEWDGSYIYEEIIWLDPRPKPTKEEWETEKARLIAYQPKQECKDKAKMLIAKTDWSVLPDRSIMIENISNFIDYRNTLLNLIINPIENPDFPKEPDVIWKN
jgi:hypothetical protein